MARASKARVQRKLREKALKRDRKVLHALTTHADRLREEGLEEDEVERELEKMARAMKRGAA